MTEANNKQTLTSLTAEQAQTITSITIPLNAISMFASLTVIVIYALMRRYYPALADRVSFRLGVCTSISDLVYSLFQLLSILETKPGFWCGFTVWGFVFASLLSTFFSDCIALNLHIMFLREYRGRIDFERYYVPASILLALIISSLPLIQNMYGWNAPEEFCWYRDSGERYNIIWQWTTLFTWLELSVLYCSVVIISVIVKLKTKKNLFDTGIDSLPLTTASVLRFKAPSKSNSLILNIIKKVTWYPVVPLITQTPNFLVETLAYSTKKVSYELLMATYVCCAIQGLLNALVFSQDVAVARGFLALRMYLWQKYVEVYESRYPQLSKNKKNPRLGDRKKTRSIIPSRKMFKREESFELTTIKDNSTKKAVMESNNQNMIDVTSEETELELIWKPTFFEKLQYLMIIKLFKAPIDFDNILKEKNTSVFDDVGLQKFQDQSTLENNHILKPSTEPEFQKLGKLDISEDVTAASDPILPLRPYYSKNINFQKKWTLISEENPLPLHLNDTQRLKRFENWPNESSSKDMDDMIISEGSLSMAPSTLAVPKKTEIIHQNTYKRTFSIPSLDEETQDTASENLPNPNSPNTSFFDVFMKRL